MSLSPDFLPRDRSNQVLKSLWQMGCWYWSGSVTKGGLSASKGWLRRFLLLKLLTSLLIPNRTDIPLLVGCVFSLRVFLLLRSPHISTKPSTVFLSHLALTDSLVLLQWILRLGVMLNRWTEEMGWEIKLGPMEEVEVLWREVMNLLCQQLHDAHQLASLLLLGLVGLEAMLVSRWPQQTRRFRTARLAQLSCSLVWTLVLLELLSSLHSKLMQDSRLQSDPSEPQISFSFCMGVLPPPSLPALPCTLRRALWLVNIWLHYTVLNSKPQKRQSLFH
ncbi:uncharacterized protein [Antennarius striatus]|uniref:uncharacterized protein n=1 Tax=Antennarius striatus TaxID=241820 RepID=UPI0035B1D5B6